MTRLPFATTGKATRTTRAAASAVARTRQAQQRAPVETTAIRQSVGRPGGATPAVVSAAPTAASARVRIPASPIITRSYRNAVIDGGLTFADEAVPSTALFEEPSAIPVLATAPRRREKEARVQQATSSRNVRARREEVDSSSRRPTIDTGNNHGTYMVEGYCSDLESVDEGDEGDSVIEAAFQRHQQQLREDEDARRHADV